MAQARTLYERALASAEAVEDFELSGSLLVNLALVHQRAAERESAAPARAREIAAAHARLDRITAAPQRYGSALHAAAALRKALLHLDSGETAAAARWADAAEAACAAPCPHTPSLALVRAQLAWQADDAAAALRHAERALAAAGSGEPNAAEQANALRHRGRAASRLGQAAQAASDLAQALAIDQRLGLPDRIALDLTWAGDAALRRGEAAAAREFYERALVVAQAAGLTASVDRLRERLGSVNKP